jgi:SpoVK/Ycf46/Vps4 family AAA+-type ATPase
VGGLVHNADTMATAEQIKALLRSHLEGDDDRFFSVALQMAARAARSGQVHFAQELRDLVDAAKSRPSIAKPTPVTRPRGDLAALLSVAYPSTRLSDMALESDVELQLRNVLLEQRQRDKLGAHGFAPQRRLLFLGPPGTGKTMSATALAGELHLPMFTIRLDGLITKYLGETAAKLRLIFDAAESTRGVYLFDEVDALASARVGGNDVGEIRRVLNSFLQFLEQDSSDSLIIATTNHPQLLDVAVFRRFDASIEFPLPTPGVVEQLVRNRLAALRPRRLSWAAIVEAAAGLSHAEITLGAERAAKESILTGEPVTTETLATSFRMRRAQPT